MAVRADQDLGNFHVCLYVYSVGHTGVQRPGARASIRPPVGSWNFTPVVLAISNAGICMARLYWGHSWHLDATTTARASTGHEIRAHPRSASSSNDVLMSLSVYTPSIIRSAAGSGDP